MKKAFLTFGMLGVFTGAATAQSSVTIFGTVDVSAKYVKNDGSRRRLSLSQDGINTNELGFRGIEDLGGGLRAGFFLSSTVYPDTGSTNAKFFNRRSTVSLYSPLGELRLGRDYVPTFWNNANFEAFGTVGLGGSLNIWQLQTPYAASPVFGNLIRSDNAIGYFLPPNLGGVYGQAMAAASEGGSNQGRFLSARLGYVAGPFNIGLSAAQQRFDAAQNPAVTSITAGSHQNTYNAGAWYDFGMFRLLGFIDRDKRDNLHETRGTLSGVLRFGTSEVRVGWHRSKLVNDLASNSNTVNLYAATYQYNLSKRTAVYTTAARLTNGDHPLAGVVQSVGGFSPILAGTTQTAQPSVGGKSTGVEFGIRHFF